MTENNKIYITASELADMLGVSVGHAYKLIASLVKYISERSQGFSTYMPVIGTGGADAGSVNDLVVYIVKTIELFKDEIDCDIHIVVSDKEEKLGLMNLKML